MRTSARSAIAEKLTPAVVAMGSVHDEGTRRRRVHAVRRVRRRRSRAGLAELLADHDDALLAAIVEDATAVPYAPAPRRAGGADRTDARAPGVLRLGDHGRGRGRVDGRDRGAAARVRGRCRRPPCRAPCSRSSAGRPERRSRTCGCSRGRSGRATGCASGTTTSGRSPAIDVFDRGSAVQRPSVVAGQIGKLWGLGDIRIGDAIGDARNDADQHHFAPPTLETVVVPRRRSDGGALARRARAARRTGPADRRAADDIRQETSRLPLRRGAEGGHPGDAGGRVRHRRRLPRDDHDLHRTTDRHRRGRRAASTMLPNPFLATVGLRIEPAAPGSGVEFRHRGRARLACRSRSSRRSTDTVRETLRQGLYGWEVDGLLGRDDALGIPGQARVSGTRLQQEHVEHGRGLPVPHAAGADGRA